MASKKIAIIFLLAVSVAFSTTNAALAMHDPDTTNPDPHSGYSTSTDFCLQCHDMHEAEGDYALMRNQTVTATCGTCHGVYVVAPEITPVPTGAYDPGYGGATATVAIDEIGFGSQSRVYEVDETEKYTHEGHRLGQRLSGAGAYQYADSSATTATAAYIPGGSKILTRIPSWSYWKGAYVDGALPAINASLWDAANEATISGGGTNALGGLYCANCHALHGDKNDTGWGNSLPESVYPDLSSPEMNNKLLSSMPNHTTPTLESVVTTWTENGYYWCARCHDKRLEVMVQQGTDTVGSPWYSMDGTGTHNHPGYVCLSCHANPFGAGGPANEDFPHSSINKNLLWRFPDDLCVFCHMSGLLP